MEGDCGLGYRALQKLWKGRALAATISTKPAASAHREVLGIGGGLTLFIVKWFVLPCPHPSHFRDMEDIQVPCFQMDEG